MNVGKAIMTMQYVIVNSHNFPQMEAFVNAKLNLRITEGQRDS